MAKEEVGSMGLAGIEESIGRWTKRKWVCEFEWLKRIVGDVLQ